LPGPEHEAGGRIEEFVTAHRAHRPYGFELLLDLRDEMADTGAAIAYVPSPRKSGFGA
jgi:hypothetical protein